MAEKPKFLRENPDRVSDLEVSHNSFIKMTINGLQQQHSFMDISEGHYHAAVSVYMNAACRVNFGPHFQFRPADDVNAYCSLLESPNMVQLTKKQIV